MAGVALALCAPSFAALAAPATLAPDLAAALKAPAQSHQRVIVQTAGRPGAVQMKALMRGGGTIGRAYATVNAFSADVSPSGLQTLMARAGVTHISPDRPVTGFKTLPKGGFAGPWDDAARAVGADVAWNRSASITGRGIGVAVLDTGVAPVEGITIAGFTDFVNGRAQPYDDNGHGTHVSGIVAGNGANAGGSAGHFLGIAPGAQLIGVKVLDANAAGIASNVINGLDWCVANRARYNIRVINLSLGQGIAESFKDDPLCQACERAVAAGIMVVAAAGNNGSGYGGVESPGNDPNVLTVGAGKTDGTPFRSDDAVAGYTSRGPTAIDVLAKPDVMAPGNHIVSLRAPGSTLDTQYPGNRLAPTTYGGAPGSDAKYFVLSGTSMATPVVSGLCALVFQQSPDLKPADVKAALMVSAQSIGGFDPVAKVRVAQYDWMTQGAGYVNVPGALTAANALSTTAAISGWGSSTIQGEKVPWSNTVIYGNRVVDGQDPDEFRHTHWGDHSVLWGDGFDNANFVLIADAVQATSILWGNDWVNTLGGASVLLAGERDTSPNQ